MDVLEYGGLTRVHRAVSIAIIPLTAMPFAAGSLNPLLDGTFIGLLIIHSYMGFQYARCQTSAR